jgi:EmrB/QacA subfamily drug resistance transporter
MPAATGVAVDIPDEAGRLSAMTHPLAPAARAVPGDQGRRPLALAAVCTLLFLTFLDNTVVSVALGDIQESLHAGVQSLQWIVNGYALVFASMMLAAGALGDKLGHRKVMLCGAVVFCGGSVVCALAPTPGVLIAGRAVMGLGAAASEPGTLAMLRHLYPEHRERARATGVWAAVSALALAFGPVIGGTILGVGSWRGIFWFNLFFGALALGVGAAVLPETTRTRGRRLDVLGTALGAVALATLVFAVIEGETAGYTSSEVLSLFAVAVVTGVGFVWRQRTAPAPVLDLRYVRAPAFSTSNLVAFAAYFGTFAIFFFCALYLRVVVGQSGYRIAAQFVPMMVAMIAASLLSGRWTANAGPRRPMIVGCVVFAVGLVLTDLAVNPTPAYLPLAAALVIAGAGIGITVVPTTFAATSAVPLERAGMASSAVNTSREIGAVAGTAVLGAIVNASLTTHLVARLQELGIPPFFQGVVIRGVQEGGLAVGAVSVHKQKPGALTDLENKVLDAVYGAFSSGLHVCLLLSAVIVLVAGAAAAVVMPAGQAEQIGELAVQTE